MAHFGYGQFPDKVTFCVSGNLSSSFPTSLARSSLGKSLLVNGVETERTEMCVSWEAQPGCFAGGHRFQVAPCWVT